MAAPTTCILVYMTARDHRQARRIGSTLIRERLAACVNILGATTSLYRWEGVVRQDREIALLAKTTRPRWKALLKRVKELHPYDVPCVVALPIRDGNPEFLCWLAAETTPLRGTVCFSRVGRPASRTAAGSKSVAARP